MLTTTIAHKQVGLEHKVYQNVGNRTLLALLPIEARTVLDVGCGAGDNARLLRERGCRVWGVTLSLAEADLARPVCEEVRVADVESEDLDLPDGFFDAMLCSHVLEHLVRPQCVLRRLSRHLKTGGFVLIAVPNMAQWRLRLRFLRGDWKFDEAGAMDNTHLHFWSYWTADELITPPLVLRARIGGDPAVPLWPLRRLVPRLCKGIDRTLGPLWLNLFTTQTLLIAVKEEKHEAP
jgi:SAM-dependent methyltransferase